MAKNNQRQTVSVALMVAGIVLLIVGAVPGLIAGLAIIVAGIILFFRSRNS